jgi:hypothetical protein
LKAYEDRFKSDVSGIFPCCAGCWCGVN